MALRFNQDFGSLQCLERPEAGSPPIRWVQSNDKNDHTDPKYAAGRRALAANLSLTEHCLPYASSIQVINDANGVAHAFLANDGQIWQCQWNAQAQQQ